MKKTNLALAKIAIKNAEKAVEKVQLKKRTVNRIKNRLDKIKEEIRNERNDSLYYAILAFSIIEVIVYEKTEIIQNYFIKSDPRRYEKIEKLIRIAAKLKIINEDTKDLIIDLKNYRNKIHIDNPAFKKKKAVKLLNTKKIFSIFNTFINNLLRNRKSSETKITKYGKALSCILNEYERQNESDVDIISKYLSVNELKQFRLKKGNKNIKYFALSKKGLIKFNKYSNTYIKIIKEVFFQNENNSFSSTLKRALLISSKHFDKPIINKELLDHLKIDLKNISKIGEDLPVFALSFPETFIQYLSENHNKEDFISFFKSESKLSKTWVDFIAYSLFYISYDKNFQIVLSLLIHYYHLSNNELYYQSAYYILDIYAPRTKASMKTRINTIHDILKPKSCYSKKQQKTLLKILIDILKKNEPANSDSTNFFSTDPNGKEIGAQSSYSETIIQKHKIANFMLRFEHDDETMLELLTAAYYVENIDFIKIIRKAIRYSFIDIDYEIKACSKIYYYYFIVNKKEEKNLLNKFLKNQSQHFIKSLTILFNEKENNYKLKEKIINYIFKKEGKTSLLDFSREVDDVDEIAYFLSKQYKLHSKEWIISNFKNANKNQKRFLANYSMEVNIDNPNFSKTIFNSIQKTKDKLEFLTYQTFNSSVLEIVLLQSNYFQNLFWHNVNVCSYRKSFSDEQITYIVHSLLNVKRVIAALTFLDLTMSDEKYIKLYDEVILSLPGKDFHYSKCKNSMGQFFSYNIDMNKIKDAIERLKEAGYDIEKYKAKLKRLKPKVINIDVSEDDQ